MDDDPLKLVYFVGYKMYHDKILKTALKFLLLVYIAVAGLHIFFFVSQPLTFQFINYGCLFLEIVWTILGIVVLLYKSNLLEDIMASTKWWSFDTTDEETRRKITNQARATNVRMTFNVVTGMVWATTMVVPSANEEAHSLVAVLLKKLLPNYWFYLNFVFALTFYLTVVTMVAHGFQVVYAIQHIKYQFYMFNSLVTSIDSDLVLEKSKMLLDKTGQDIIAYRLKVLIRRHRDFITWKNCVLDQMSNLIVPFSIGGFIVGMATAFGFLQIANDPSPVTFFRALAYGTNALSIGCSILSSGQSVEDEGENIYRSFLLTKWYQWDQRNQKLYLVVVCNAKEPLKIKFTEEIGMNHRMGMAICRTVFSGCSVFYGME